MNNRDMSVKDLTILTINDLRGELDCFEGTPHIHISAPVFFLEV